MAEKIKVIYDLVDEMSGDLKKINAQMETFTKETKDNSKGVQNLTKYINLGTVSVAAFGVAAVKAGGSFAGLTKDIITQSNQIQKYSDSTTIATKTISSLTTAVKKGGGEIDNVGDIVQDFTEKLGDARDGSQTYKDAFNRLGVDISGSPQQALEKTIDTLSNMEDQSAALFRGIELFGDSYKLISNQIAQGNNVLNESPLFSDDIIRASRSFTENIARMGTELKTAVNQSLSPFIQDMDELIGMLDDSGMWDNFVGGVSSAAGWASKLSGFMKDAILAVNQIALDKQQKRADDLGKKLSSYIKKQNAGIELDGIKEAREKKIQEIFKERQSLLKEIEQRQDNIHNLVSGRKDDNEVIVKSIRSEISAANDLAKAYQPIFDFQSGGAGFRGLEVSSDLAVDPDEKWLEDNAKTTEVMRLSYEERLGLTENYINSTDQLFDAFFAGRLNALQADTQAEIQNVKTSTMSQKKKNEEIAKIEKKAQKESLKIRTNQWRMDLLTATANTALSVSRALSNPPGVPYTIPFGIAAGAAGAATIATIAANKPKFAMGGVFDGNGIVSGTRMNGDTVNANINAGEAVINREQMRNFMDIANGKTETVNNNQRTNHITVNALEPQTAAGAVVQALEHAVQNNGVDTSILSVAAV